MLACLPPPARKDGPEICRKVWHAPSQSRHGLGIRDLRCECRSSARSLQAPSPPYNDMSSLKPVSNRQPLKRQHSAHETWGKLGVNCNSGPLHQLRPCLFFTHGPTKVRRSFCPKARHPQTASGGVQAQKLFVKEGIGFVVWTGQTH